MFVYIHGQFHLRMEQSNENENTYVYEERLFACFIYLFCLSHWDLPNHGASCRTLGTIGKPSMDKGATSWFHNFLTYIVKVIEYWIIF